jgi:PleD family two-component response regulator
MTVSFGVTGFNADQLPKNLKADDILRRADEYLYQAKNEGRNKVVSGPFTSDAELG